MGPQEIKKPCSITCSSALRDAVQKLSQERGVNAGDIARSVLLLVPEGSLQEYTDPGDAETSDRPNGRKPRLQMRLPKKYPDSMIRKALSLAVLICQEPDRLQVEQPNETDTKINLEKQLEESNYLNRALKDSVNILGKIDVERIANKSDAMVILGFAPNDWPNRKEAQAHYRLLARVFHPDSGIMGDARRMSAINAAWDMVSDVLK